jgi:hypothetical protein
MSFGAMQEWSSDTLWNKGKLYLARAFERDRTGDLFPFYASLGLEFLARAALASVHPALLADPQDGNNILYAFGFPATARPTSIPTKTVFSRLKFVIDDFSDDDLSLCTLMSELRNQELHTGALAFADLATGKWLANFYRVLQKIVKRLGFKLEDVLGTDEALHASTLISKAAQNVTKDVRERVGKLKSKITVLSTAELARRRKAGEPKFAAVQYTAGHCVFNRKCPACDSAGFLVTTPIKATAPRLKDGQVVSQKIFWPTRFECKVCELKLAGYEELQVVGLGDEIVDEQSHDPVEYFGIDVSEYITEDMIRENIQEDYGND